MRVPFVLAMSCCLSPPAHVVADEAPRPHIILMMADDLGWGDVGYHGGKIDTPNIDALARRGVRLEQFYAQPVCSPTRAALMTGLYPYQLGLQCGVIRPWAQHGLPLKLPFGARTLPEELRDAGYRTAIVGKWHLGHLSREYLPTSRGFDLQYGHYNGALDYFTHRRDGGHDWHRNDRPNYDEGYATDLIGAEAVRVIAGHDRRKPLFLYVPFNAPHTPLQAPKKYLERYAEMKDRRRQTFAAMVTCMDDAVGAIVAALSEHEFPPEETLLIFCSDNGGIPRLGSNGKLRGRKGTLYEGGVRVPAVMVWDSVLPAGKRVEEPLHVIDMYPALLHLAGRKSRHGHSLWPTVSAGKPRPDITIVHNVTPFHAAVRVGDWKLIHNGHVAANATRAHPEEKWELFNIKEDPYETNDRAGEPLPLLGQLKEKIASLRQQMAKPHIAPNRPPAGFKVPEVWGQFDE